MSRTTTVHVVVPEGIDDPERASGGNRYDRRAVLGLRDAGWVVREHAVAGTAALARALASAPEGALALVDGLVATAETEVVAPAARRLRVVVLLHLPRGASGDDPWVRGRERTVLAAAAAVVTTSRWTRSWVLDHYGLPPDHVHVAEPGVDIAAASPGSPSGCRLLGVAACTPAKGHDVLLTALAGLRQLEWRLTLVGSLHRDPHHVGRLVRQAEAAAIADRVELVGARTGRALAASYATADVLVHPSLLETYGMVVTEALAHGLPVLTTTAGGLPDALGSTGGAVPGLLVPAGDPDALAEALRRWLEDPRLRAGLRRAAHVRRSALPGWDTTTKRLAEVLRGAAA